MHLKTVDVYVLNVILEKKMATIEEPLVVMQKKTVPRQKLLLSVALYLIRTLMP